MSKGASDRILVEGVVITPEHIAPALSVMRRYRFTANDVIGSLTKAGVPLPQARRAADRLIQRQRKAGEIVFNSSGATRDRAWTYRHHPAHQPARRSNSE